MGFTLEQGFFDMGFYLGFETELYNINSLVNNFQLDEFGRLFVYQDLDPSPNGLYQNVGMLTPEYLDTGSVPVVPVYWLLLAGLLCMGMLRSRVVRMPFKGLRRLFY